MPVRKCTSSRVCECAGSASGERANPETHDASGAMSPLFGAPIGVKRSALTKRVPLAAHAVLDAARAVYDAAMERERLTRACVVRDVRGPWRSLGDGTRGVTVR